MKKVIKVKDLCCSRCAKRLEIKLELCEGVLKARANYKKNHVFIEVMSSVTDETLEKVVNEAGFEFESIEPRKGLFD